MIDFKSVIVNEIHYLDALLPEAVPCAEVIRIWIAQQIDPWSEVLRQFTSAQAPESGDAEDSAAHDEFFRIRRVQGNAPRIFLRTLSAARQIYAHESLRPANFFGDSNGQAADRSLRDLLTSLGVRGEPRAGAPGSVPRAAGIVRWIRGHQIFAALTQGLIMTFDALGRALRAGDRGAVRLWTDLCITLFEGSTAAMTFTGDLPVEEYNGVIRPSMMEPAAPLNLSGLMSRDHRFLARQMRELRPALRSLYELEPGRHNVLASALAEVYDSHAHVCARFVGLKPSLLTAGRTEKSGPSLIEQFKTLRLKAFEHQQRAERIEPAHAPKLASNCPFGNRK